MTIKLLRPVSRDFRMSSPYGERTIDGKKEFHYGYDFATPIGTSVYACDDGAAFRCGWENALDQKQGFGYRIWQEIQQEIDGKKTRFYVWYGHLSKIFIKEGDRIKRGQEIGLTGKTGRIITRLTGPEAGAHLHIEARELNARNRKEIEFI